MILPLVLLTNLAVTCAPQVAPATLAAVARTESDFQTLAIGDNTARRSYSPHDKSEAVALARQLMTEGHDLDLGLMQINQRNFGWLGLTVEDAFDPCRSIAAGAVVLTSLSRYNTGNPWAGISNGYVARILSAEKGANSNLTSCIPPLWPPRLRINKRRHTNGMHFPILLKTTGSENDLQASPIRTRQNRHQPVAWRRR